MMPCAVCTMHMETRSASFLVEPQNQDRLFPDLDLKTGSSALMIWASKSLWWFLGVDLKTKRSSVCRLHHKTDGRMIRCGARVEIWWLALPRSKSCYGFIVWPQDSRRRDDGWCTWHHSRGCVELKLKKNG
jgi:hypothetical protein